MDRELHIFGVAVHGALVSLHGLGVFYGLRRRKYLHVLVHSLALAYGLTCVRAHMKEVRRD